MFSPFTKPGAEMVNQEIQQATASEPLSLEEEYKMQQSWRTDKDKLTFITCLPLPGERTSIIAGEQDATARMIGDVNLFLTEDNSNGDENANANTLLGEIELMIATKENQGRGYGRASLLAFLQFIHTREKDILDEFARGQESPQGVPPSLAYLRVKIAESNGRSIRLFESVGFQKVAAEANYFGEVELRLAQPLSERLVSLREKFGIAGFREIVHG